MTCIGDMTEGEWKEIPGLSESITEVLIASIRRGNSPEESVECIGSIYAMDLEEFDTWRALHALCK